MDPIDPTDPLASFIPWDAEREGVQTTESGLQYIVLQEGTGATPTASNIVKVHYEGKLINGEIFDSSIQRGEPIVFGLNRVIPGWTEGLQLIGKGGKVKLVIPSDLAYGDHGAPPRIPGGSTLIFEVELFNVTKAAAPKPAKKKGKKK